MSTSVIHQGLAYELSVTINTGRYGHDLKFISLVPTARRPEPQVKFQANLCTAELVLLYEAIGRTLGCLPVYPSSSSGELVHH